jgi:hypothetical protein
MANTTTAPAFFSTVKLPSVARWAMDKVKAHKPEVLDVAGKKVIVENYYFEGHNMFPCSFKGEWQIPQEGVIYNCTVLRNGRNPRPGRGHLMVAFTVYRTEDGSPVPTD